MVEEYRIEQMPELINKIKAAIDSAEGVPVTKTATGNPIEITDGADAPLVKCNVEVQGTQSGSGAPSPTNIRPFITISGFSVAVANAATNPTVTKTYTVTLPAAIYHGIVDLIAKTITYDWGYIASYDGEELPGNWISSMDVYEEGTTPTAGASVAYELAEPVTADITVTNAPVESLHGFNKIASTSGALDIEYFTSKCQPIIDLVTDTAAKVVYSTTERAIGTWTDGSIVYEKTIVSEQALTDTWSNYAATTGMDVIVSVEPRYTRDSEEVPGSFSGTEIASWIHRDGYIKVCTPTDSADWNIESMTIRYTKSAS